MQGIMPCSGKPAKADLAKYPQQQAVAPVEPETPDPKARLATGSCHESCFEIRVLAGEATYKDVVFPTPASYPAEWGLGLVRAQDLCSCPAGCVRHAEIHELQLILGRMGLYEAGGRGVIGMSLLP